MIILKEKYRLYQYTALQNNSSEEFWLVYSQTEFLSFRRNYHNATTYHGKLTCEPNDQCNLSIPLASHK